MLLLNVALIILSSIGISKSAGFVLYAVERLAKRFRISDFTLGFFVLGILTSTPELFVAINSSLNNIPQLSFGNLMGGIIVLLTLVIGSTAVLTGKISFKDTFSQKELLLTGFLLISPVFLIADGIASRFDGLLLISFYLVFFLIMNKKETFLEKVKDKLTEKPIDNIKLFLKLILGIAGLVIFSKIIVNSALVFSQSLNIAPFVVGFLLLSIGTNLPELSLAALSKGDHQKLAIGDFLGSAAANIPLLGFLALISPFEITNGLKLYMGFATFLLTIVAFSSFARSKRTINREEGLILLSIYALFLIIEVILSSSLMH